MDVPKAFFWIGLKKRCNKTNIEFWKTLKPNLIHMYLHYPGFFVYEFSWKPWWVCCIPHWIWGGSDFIKSRNKKVEIFFKFWDLKKPQLYRKITAQPTNAVIGQPFILFTIFHKSSCTAMGLSFCQFLLHNYVFGLKKKK